MGLRQPGTNRLRVSVCISAHAQGCCPASPQAQSQPVFGFYYTTIDYYTILILYYYRTLYLGSIQFYLDLKLQHHMDPGQEVGKGLRIWLAMMPLPPCSVSVLLFISIATPLHLSPPCARGIQWLQFLLHSHSPFAVVP